MTARDGFPRDMDALTLDAGTAERLMTGAVDVGDAPPEYRGVARTFQALREPPDSSELVGLSAVVDRIAATVVLERRARRSRRSRRSATRMARLAAASVVACGLSLAGGLASVGALPEPAQNVASTVLGQVGISFPTGGEEKPADHKPSATTPASAAPPTTTSVQPTPIGNGSDAPTSESDPPSSTSPHGSSQGELPGARARGTPPPTANGDGKEHAPDGAGAPNSGNGRGLRP